MPNETGIVAGVVRDICEMADETDGLSFDSESLEAVVIKEDADYEGVRVTFLGHLQTARIHMQIDMGFGDVVVPAAIDISYPTILDHDPPQIKGYPRETTVAEKYEAMVKLGQLNSRIRDFFDVWMLSRQFEFDGPVFSRAIRETFANRGTDIDIDPVAFKPEFASDTTKQTQWTGFCRKSRIDFAPDSLDVVCDSISGFLTPVANSILTKVDFNQQWNPPGPWKPG